ncbi:hypothetical protein [Rhizobium sp. C4]|uniref:hypothetical protein n=1 Tax=Rhizobium sp. C4 TaxID=1349800 RepID=UPI001E418F3C|nr:hypothetical protein [Rhizobium sp. C4]MCD2172604.1 hypothetical protein [Rhizobium sp. C4]
MTRRSLTLAVVCLWFGLIAAFTWYMTPTRSSYSQDQLDFLASDAHVIVGDVPLTIPFVALSEFSGVTASFSLNKAQDRLEAKTRRDTFRVLASRPDTAPALDRVEITIGSYGSDDFQTGKLRLCSLLKRQWAKSVCNAPWAPLRQALPKTFYLADDRQFAGFNHLTVGGERMSDQLRQMTLETGRVSIVCDSKVSSANSFCTSAILIEPHMAAVWTVFDNGGETARQMAERQGPMLVAFARSGVGANEDYPALISTACGLRGPDAPVGPHGDQCGSATETRPERSILN